MIWNGVCSHGEQHSRLVLMLWALMCESALEMCVSSACRLILMTDVGLMLKVFVALAVP